MRILTITQIVELRCREHQEVGGRPLDVKRNMPELTIVFRHSGQGRSDRCVVDRGVGKRFSGQLKTKRLVGAVRTVERLEHL